MDFSVIAMSGLTIAHSPSFADKDYLRLLQQHGIQCTTEADLSLAGHDAPALLLVDLDHWNQLQSSNVIPASPAYLIGCEEGLEIPANFFLPKDQPQVACLKNIQLALTTWLLKKEHSEIGISLENKLGHLSRLADIGIALSSEKKLSALLSRILSEGRALGCCDAASLFLIDESDPDSPQMVFTLAQNASIQAQFVEQRFDLNDHSIAGYVACHDTELSIVDAYAIPQDKPYSFNSNFDIQVGYRSVSLLAMPMKNYRGQVIGVLQFINRTKQPGVQLFDPQTALENTIPFDEKTTVLLRALASQSAIAIENRLLIENIRQLFDGFVKASVVAIEQRDPTTSGHSFRVADLCLGLADVLPRTEHTEYRNIVFSKNDLRQLRYAALLHDFGKVGVREAVLIKPKKLTTHQYDIIQYRIRLTQESLRSQCFEKQLEIMKGSGDEKQCQEIQNRAMAEIRRLDGFWYSVVAANEPSILQDETAADLREIAQYQALTAYEDPTALINAEELNALSIAKGSLTPEERLEIESHVTHTENFLRLIPWTPELSNIPDIAAAHHEKLNGAGYPKGLVKNQIPVPSRIMTVCDIYDALTASDRPYKPAVPHEVAFNILNAEAKSGLLDQDLVDIFIEARVFDVVENKQYASATSHSSQYHHHVCDFDLMDHDDDHQH